MTALLSLLVMGVAGLWVLGGCADPLAPRLEQLETLSRGLAHQLALQQLHVEETTRSQADSGGKQMRVGRDGTAPYMTATWVANSMMAMHDHSNLLATCGMGEIVMVLNGVEFRTRHNDYKVKMRSPTSTVYNDREYVPYPGVPQAVLDQPTVDLQIQEMRGWFRAWQDQNYTERDYRPYFKPVLCYMEGAWTTDSGDIDEPFDSDRHAIAADSWMELLENIRFTSYTGDKDNLENFAFLPTSLFSLTESGTPVLAQWNYQINCHPIRDLELTLADLQPVDSLASRFYKDNSYLEYKQQRTARFQLKRDGEEEEGEGRSLLDRIMAQIPGMDNYAADISDTVYGQPKLCVVDDQPLNAGYYHRWYKLGQEGGPRGNGTAKRAFADRNIFMARTTQPKISPLSYRRCSGIEEAGQSCQEGEARVSFAIPMEIVWTTPLNTWNPYDVHYKGESNTEEGKTVKADGRNGGLSLDKAYNGTSSRQYYQTPVEFFEGGEVNTDPADTATADATGVLDRQGELRLMKASGIRVYLPEIMGVGKLRLRYPIMPVHAEGDPIMKELQALTDMAMEMGSYGHLFRSNPPFASGEAQFVTTTTPAPIHTVLHTGLSDTEPRHSHFIDVTEKMYKNVEKWGKVKEFVTSWEAGHSHKMEVAFNTTSDQYYMLTCDGKFHCAGNHGTVLTRDVDMP